MHLSIFFSLRDLNMKLLLVCCNGIEFYLKCCAALWQNFIITFTSGVIVLVVMITDFMISLLQLIHRYLI